MDLSDIALDTDIEGLASLLENGAPGPQFCLGANRVHVHKAKAEAKAARRGDFVLCDLIPMLIEARGRCPHLHVATLGLSAANAQTLVSLRARGLLDAITLVCSHYFAQVDKTTTYREVIAALNGIARVIITRAHAKVICLPTSSGDHFVIEGSANLRSSDNTEQIVIFNDPELLAWHAGWMEAISDV